MGYNRWVYPEGSSAVICFNYNPQARTLYVVYTTNKAHAYVYKYFTPLSASKLLSADSVGGALHRLTKQSEKRWGKSPQIALEDLPDTQDPVLAPVIPT